MNRVVNVLFYKLLSSYMLVLNEIVFYNECINNEKLIGIMEYFIIF